MTPLEAAGAELLVADSFRVRMHEGRAETRGFSLHAGRFRSSARAAAAERRLVDGAEFPATLDAFLGATPGKIAASGDGFPRFELWASSDLRLKLTLALRPLPTLGNELALRSVPALTALAHPERKGPGIASYAALARTLGAEPLLIERDGRAIEGGTTSLLWWQGGEARVSASAARVASVTEHLVREALEAAGVRVVAAAATPAELARSEVWALNALHGIRTVSSIDGVRLPSPDHARLALARTALDQCWAPIDRQSAPS